jgi:hypothetical protein
MGGAHEGYFKCLIMGKNQLLLKIKKEERLVVACYNYWG